MDSLRLKCLRLRTLVCALVLDHAAISTCAQAIEQQMQTAVIMRSVPEFVHARYHRMRDIDYIFEALCHTLFDNVFKVDGMKHKHASRLFVEQIWPFQRAGVLRCAMPYYIHRFRTRRYSYQHRVHRYERAAMPVYTDFQAATALMALRHAT